MIEYSDRSTLAEAAAQRLRRAIVVGDLAPAARLRLRDLVAHYGVGATPLREALNRLVAEGLVVLEGHRGFSVPPVTRAHLLDITRTRQLVEPEALRLAMADGGREWEDEVVASLSLLRRAIEQHEPGSTEWLDRYESRHHRFHRALIAACPLPSLLRFCDDLYVQKTRYRRLMGSAAPDWALALRVHEALAEGTLQRRPATAEALRQHIGTTAEHVLALLGEVPPDPAPMD
ncbi:GntR family transcriptional regulator [Roseomonas sp. BN140053]|uniref:GntR family transcriptional regulator n=1 Tax=Roseomonas sp. BN140053 TaxID=3391898 RepID=UPI0039EB6282